MRLISDHICPDCVIIDTIREAHTGDENDSTAMQSVVAQLTAAVKPAALVLVAHSRKANFEHGPDLMNDNRGSNYMVGKMDVIIRFSHSSMRVSGRSIDEQSIPIERLDNGLWELALDPTESLALDLLATGKPIRELARVLHETSGKSESAARAYLRRLNSNINQK